MKKIIILCAMMMLSALTINAAERGKFIHVDNSVNKNLKPQLAFCQDRKDGKDITMLLVKTVNVNGYNEFTDASRVLLKFTDGKAVRLNKAAGTEVQKNKHSEKSGRATITKYETITSYEVSPEIIQYLEKNQAITKVRIVFKENEAKDYDIAEGYQTKMAEDLLKSYQEAALNNRKNNSDLSDEDF